MDCRLKPGKDGENWVSIQSEHALSAILDVGLRPVVAGGGLGLPLAVRRLVFDHLGTAGHPRIDIDAFLVVR